MNLPDRSVGTASILILVLVSLVAACAGATGGSSGSAATGPPPSASAAPSEAPGPSGGFLDPAVLTACLTLGPQDCERARTVAASEPAAGDPPVRYVQVGPFSCATGDRCPLTLLARPEGDVVLEFPDGQGLNVHLKVAADGTFEAIREPAIGVAVEPSSTDNLAAGPGAFSLGHCGIFSGIDAAGAWWDPVGSVDMDSGDAINAADGVLTLLDPDHATFTTPRGFALQLVRRDGPKLLPMCM